MKWIYLLAFFAGVLAMSSLASALFVDNGSLAQNIYDCGYTNFLNTTNAVYTLNTSISSTVNCLTVRANNITINGAGYQITYDGNNTVAGWGINISAYNFTTVKNALITESTLGASSKHAISMTLTNNNTIINNTMSTKATSSVSIYMWNADSSLIKDNVMYGSSSNAKSISLAAGADLDVFINNYVWANSSNGGMAINSNSRYNQVDGLFINTSAPSSNPLGLQIYSGCDNTYVKNVTAIGSGSASMLSLGGSGGADMKNITIVNSTFISYYQGQRYGLVQFSYRAVNASIIDTILNASNGLEVGVSTARNGVLNLTNVSRLNGSPIDINWSDGANGTVFINSYFKALVNDSSTHAAISGANVTSWDITGALSRSNLTESDGSIDQQVLLAVRYNESTGLNNPTVTDYGNYTVNVSASGYTTYTNSSINMTLGSLFLFVPLVSTGGAATCTYVSGNWVNSDSICNITTVMDIRPNKFYAIGAGHGFRIYPGGALLAAGGYVDNGAVLYDDNSARCYIGT